VNILELYHLFQYLESRSESPNFKDQAPRYWEKIAKRYITAFGRSNSNKLLNEIENIYLNYPGLRVNLLIYLANLGYSKRAAEKVEYILNSIDVFDDISLYQICNLITLWEVPLEEKAGEFIERVDNYLFSSSFKSKNPADFYSALWFKAKYSHPQDLVKFVKDYQNLWQSNSFLSRQVTAVIARLLKSHEKNIEGLLKLQISSGIPSTVSLENQIQSFTNLEKIDKKLAYYLFPKNQQRPYPLQKFLVLCSVLNSEKIRTNTSIKIRFFRMCMTPIFENGLTISTILGDL
jgi:hypothetical protein